MVGVVVVVGVIAVDMVGMVVVTCYDFDGIGGHMACFDFDVSIVKTSYGC